MILGVLSISTPIWSGAGYFDSPCIGIRCDRVKGYARVTIDYTDRHGNKTFPGEFGITKKQAAQYPVKDYAWGQAYIIPIRELRKYFPKKKETEGIGIKEAIKRGYLKL